MTKFHFLQFQKRPKINFWTGKKFKNVKNAISWKKFDLFDITSFLAWNFFKFSGPLYTSQRDKCNYFRIRLLSSQSSCVYPTFQHLLENCIIMYVVLNFRMLLRCFSARSHKSKNASVFQQTIKSPPYNTVYTLLQTGSKLHHNTSGFI